VTPEIAREEHELILERVGNGDINRAVAALTNHLENSIANFQEQFRENPELFTGVNSQ